MEAAIHNIQNATKAADGAANDWVLASSGWLIDHLVELR